MHALKNALSSAISPRLATDKPFLKWVGGKGQLLPRLLSLLPPKFNRYFEPFLGGGALFFRLKPSYSILSDRNEELINCYRIVQHQVDDLILLLKRFHNHRDMFYDVRQQNISQLTPLQRAARFIFLNRTCYNGLYRVNRQGQFNVPFGCYKNPNICAQDTLKKAATTLKNAQIVNSCAFDMIRNVEKKDLIYCDPPYYAAPDKSGFTQYTAGGFDCNAQIQLSEYMHELNQRGAYVIVSNSNTALIRKLYKSFKCHQVMARRAINCHAQKRGPISELILTNF
jgi:DNA adenine methylase